MQEDATVVHQTEADCPPGSQHGTPEIGVIARDDAYT